MYEFKRLIDKYKKPFTLERAIESENQERDDLGRLIGTKYEAPVTEYGAVIPMPQRVVYQSGGRFTEADRNLYTLNKNIPQNSIVTYNGMIYYVESKTPYEDYSDFSFYNLKAVTAFND